MKKGIVCLLITLCYFITHAQNVGIGTTTPRARLHVLDSSVLFSAADPTLAVPGNTPLNGAGARMMWYPGKAAFRAGYIDGAQWDKDSIGYYSFAAGSNTKALGYYSTSLGNNTQARGYYSTSMGNQTIATGLFSTSMGDQTNATGNNSTSMGRQTTASGSYSTSMGLGTKAIGLYSTSMGFVSSADGNYSTSMGRETIASGEASTSMGLLTTAGGTYSTSMGNQTNATGEYSTSMGYFTNARGLSTTSMGQETSANGDYSTSMGFLTTASGGASTSMGQGTTASGFYSTSLGLNTKAKAYGSFTAGVYNDEADNPSPTSVAPTDRIFQIGNGIFSLRSNALTILRNGNIGIGTVTPSAPLSFSNSFGTKISLYHGSYGDVGIGVEGGELRLQNDIPNGKVSMGVIETTGSFTELARAQRNGTISFTVNGSLMTNSTLYPSDERFKQNIVAISSPLQKIQQLNGVEYEMRVSEFPQYHFMPGRQIGLLAQNLEKVIPEAVNELDGYKGVDYAKLVPLLIEGIKDQQKQIETTNKEVKQLRQQHIKASSDEVKQLQQQVTELKKLVEQLIKK